MASFHNADRVQNQAAHQIIHGNVNFYSNGSVSSKRRQFGNHVDSSEQELDNEILASLAFPQMFDRRRNVDPPHDDTCQWIFGLEQYQNWVTNPFGLLWIKGKPGAGKSTLMAHLYSALYKEHLNHGGAHLEFFFTARGELLQRTPVGMLRSLLNQIFYQDPDVRDCLRKPYQDKCDSFGQGERLWNWQYKELESLLMDTILISAQKQQLTIFIDALDEAGDQFAREVARYFHAVNDRISKASGTARICISCRHYPIPSNVKSVEINVEEHNHDDINAFVRGNIKLDDLVISESDELEKWQDVVETLVQQAQGVFQWASVVVPLVERSMSDGDSPEEVSQWLHQVPGDLEGVYEHILMDVIDERYRAKSLRLFQWVCLPEYRLSLENLRYALASHDITLSPRTTCIDTKDFIKSNNIMALRVKSWSGGLLELAHIGDDIAWATVQVIHQSVDDFLMKKGFAFLAMLVAREHDAHSTINTSSLDLASTYCGHLYWGCLSYIAIDLDGVRSVEGRKVATQEARAPDTVMQRKHPFLNNAILNLLPLAHRAGNYRSGDLQKELDLLDAAVHGWLMVGSLDYLWEEIDLYHCATPLHFAAAGGMKDLTQILIQRNVDIDAPNRKGWTPLYLAIKHGHLALAKMLISANASLKTETQDRMTPLLIAASYGHIEIFNWLIDLGASVTEIGPDSETVLHVAAQEGHVLMVRLCLKAGIDVNTQGGYYGNALQAASVNGHRSVVNTLLQAGANVNALGGWYGHALQAAASLGSRCVKILLQAGANVNAQGGRFGNALQSASASGSYQTCIDLIAAGADVHAQGGYYGNALQAASRFGYEHIVYGLIEAGVDVNARGGYYETALQAASLHKLSSWRHARVVEALLDAGADVNVRGGQYGSALEAALHSDDGDDGDEADEANEVIIDMLIEAGAQREPDKTSESDTT